MDAQVVGLVEFYSVEELSAEWKEIDEAVKKILKNGGMTQVAISQNGQSASYSSANIEEARERQRCLMIAIKIKQGKKVSRGVK